MSETIRRLYNSVERLFDRHALSREIRFSRNTGDSPRPVTAKHAFDTVLPLAKELDRKACLKMIVSQQGVDGDGAAAQWEFFFDLPDRRAKLVCEWMLHRDETADDYGSSYVEGIARPFPPADSPLHQLAREGKLLHRQIIGHWKQERKRSPDFPHFFRDSDAALADFVKQGLDLRLTEFSLSTGQSPHGRLCWMAQTRHQAYYASFT